jgi:hypothetical protein
MSRNFWNVALCSVAIGLAATSIARADCESDLIQFEQAFKTPNLAANAKAALDDAKPLAVAALKKDDDAACHKAIADGMAKAGMALN